MEKEVKVIFDRDFIEHDVFNHLPGAYRLSIRKDCEAGLSTVAAFYVNDVFKFCAVLNFELGGKLHVQEVAGNFGRFHFLLFRFCENLARITKRNQITFCTSKRAVKKWGANLAFQQENDYYTKDVR